MLTILVLSPIAVGLTLLLLPLVLPSQAAESVKRISRNVSLGVALALFSISTWAAMASISDINWMDIQLGDYHLENTPVNLIPYIGVSWHVGADALSFPMCG